MKKLIVLSIFIISISSIFAWNHNLVISFTYPDGRPSGATNMPEPDGNIDRYSGDECHWIQDGMWFAAWISKVSPAYEVSDTFFAGDYEWGHMYRDSGGYYVSTFDAYKTVERTELLELSWNDTLHLRFWHIDGYEEYYWGLDTVFTEDPTGGTGLVFFEAEMVYSHLYMGPGFSPCWDWWLKLKQIDSPENSSPKTFTLAQNTPNPFNAKTSIEYSIPDDADVSLDVYDIDGRRIANLINEHQSAGNYNIKWDGTDDYGNLAATGTYFYKLVAGDYEIQKTMILIK